MQKILIADSSRTLTSVLAKRLGVEFMVMCCHDGLTALNLISTFEPDVLVLDLSLADFDGMQILRSVRLSGNNMQVLASIPNDGDYILSQLRYLQVSQICRRPCHPDSMVCSIRDMALQQHLIPGSPEMDLDNILVQLGFRMGFAMYSNTYAGIMLTFAGGISTLSKDLYPNIAATYGGTTQQVEKSIRDGIHRAYKNGNRAIWRMYFGSIVDAQCPSNELFMSRIARILQLRYGMPKPQQQKEA